MKQISWENGTCSDRHEIPCVSWNLKVLHRWVHLWLLSSATWIQSTSYLAFVDPFQFYPPKYPSDIFPFGSVLKMLYPYLVLYGLNTLILISVYKCIVLFCFSVTHVSSDFPYYLQLYFINLFDGDFNYLPNFMSSSCCLHHTQNVYVTVRFVL
jgi:hypothetical protein